MHTLRWVHISSSYIAVGRNEVLPRRQHLKNVALTKPQSLLSQGRINSTLLNAASASLEFLVWISSENVFWICHTQISAPFWWQRNELGWMSQARETLCNLNFRSQFVQADRNVCLPAGTQDLRAWFISQDCSSWLGEPHSPENRLYLGEGLGVVLYFHCSGMGDWSQMCSVSAVAA